MSPRTKKNPAQHGTLAIVERNLERYPWARLSDDKGEQLALELLIERAGAEGRAWVVTTKDASRIPGPFDADLYVALCQAYNAAGRPADRTIRVTYADLIALMHRHDGGGVYDAITAALHRLAQVNIRAVHTWRDGEYVAELETFNIFESTKTRFRRDGAAGGHLATVRFSEEVAASIAAGNFRLLNTAEYFALDSPTAKRLYRYLDYRRWRGSERLPELTLSLKQLAQELPIDRAAPSHIRRTLDPAHEHLVERGFLAAVTYDERPVPGKKRPLIWVTYLFAEPVIPATPMMPASQKSAPVPAGSVAESSVQSAPTDAGAGAWRAQLSALLGVPNARAGSVSDLAWWVGEIERTLGDRRSSGFYKQVVEAFAGADALDALEFVLRGVQRDGAGMPAKALGAAFTARVKARAAELHLALPAPTTGPKRGAGVTPIGALLPGVGNRPDDPLGDPSTPNS